MRCLTLADALKQRGARTRFVSHRLPEYLRSMLAAKGHEFFPLNGDRNAAALDELAHAHWLGGSQEQDAVDSIRALSDVTWDWLVADHYALDARWESSMHRIVNRIMAIDDIADRQHDCDMLLDQNFYTDMQARYSSKVPPHCRLLLGPRYALLRDEFRQLREQIRPRTGPVKRVLVFFGGVDADNYTGRAIEALSETGIPSLHVDVVIGTQHPCREQIKMACGQHGYICHIQTDKMAELMATADLAIGAGGSASWERCCLGLPTLTICTADNQRKQIADAASESLLYAPRQESDLTPLIRRHMDALMDNDYLRQAISRNGMRAIDGCGALRVVGNLGCCNIEIRVATQDDSANLFEWRNHPAVRAVSRKSDVINWEDHQKWLALTLVSADRLLLIGQRENSPVGVVRFDIQDDEAEVSVYLVPDIKPSGQGRELLQSAEYWLVANRPEVARVRATVLGGNERSSHLFLNADYQVEFTSYLKRLL